MSTSNDNVTSIQVGKRGRPTPPKRDRALMVAMVVAAEDARLARQAEADAALASLRAAYEAQCAETMADYGDLPALSASVYEAVKPLRKDWGNEPFEISPEQGGGFLLIREAGEKRGAQISFLQRKSVIQEVLSDDDFAESMES